MGEIGPLPSSTLYTSTRMVKGRGLDVNGSILVLGKGV